MVVKKAFLVALLLLIAVCRTARCENEENNDEETTSVTNSPEIETTSEAESHDGHEADSETHESGDEPPKIEEPKRNATKIDWEEIKRMWDAADPDEEVTRKWNKYNKGIQAGIKGALSALFPKVAGAMQTDAKVSGNCSAGMLKFIVSLRYLRNWAVKMMDAMGKPPSGMLEGAVTAFGNYPQCTKIRVPDDDDEDDDDDLFGEDEEDGPKKPKEFKEFFRGMYCSIEFKPSLPAKPRYYGFETRLNAIPKFPEKENFLNEVTQWAVFLNFIAVRFDICIPSLCTIDDMQKLISLVSKHAEIRGRVLRCEVEKDSAFEDLSDAQVTAMLLFIVVLLSFGVLTAMSVCFFSRVKNPSTVLRFLNSLSWTYSYKELMNTDIYDKGKKLASLYGVRYVVMLWIILVHMCVIVKFQFLRDLMPMKEAALSAGAQIMTRSALQFESLIIITGFCMAYYNERNGAFKALKTVIRKYFRLIPIIMVAVGIMILLPVARKSLLGGPTWSDFVPQPSEACQRYGYVNLFFVQNFNLPEHMCLPQTWLFCVEMQLALAFIPVFGILSRFKVFSWILLFVITVAGLIINVLTVYNHQLPPTLMWTIPDPEQRDYYYHVHFFMPWAHLSVWTIGVAAGHYCHNRNKNNYSGLPKPYKNLNYRSMSHVLGTIVSFLVMLGAVTLWPSWVLGHMPTPLYAGFFDGFSKIFWALATVFLLYVVTVKVEEEKQSAVTQWLSSRFCIIMGRLTLVAFIIHPIVQIVFLGTQQTQVFSSMIIAMYGIIGNVVASFAIAFVLSILFELPCSSLLTARKPSRAVLQNKSLRGKDNPMVGNGDMEMTKERF